MARLPKGFIFDRWVETDGHIYANIKLTKWAVFKLKLKAYFNVIKGIRLVWHG